MIYHRYIDSHFTSWSTFFVCIFRFTWARFSRDWECFEDGIFCCSTWQQADFAVPRQSRVSEDHSGVLFFRYII